MFKVDDAYVNSMSLEQLRREYHDFAGRWYALAQAFRDLPELPSPELQHVLSDFAKWPEDWERGKAMQRKGMDITPVTEAEQGAGFWSVVRAALISART